MDIDKDFKVILKKNNHHIYYQNILLDSISKTKYSYLDSLKAIENIKLLELNNIPVNLSNYITFPFFLIESNNDVFLDKIKFIYSGLNETIIYNSLSYKTSKYNLCIELNTDHYSIPLKISYQEAKEKLPEIILKDISLFKGIKKGNLKTLTYTNKILKI